MSDLKTEKPDAPAENPVADVEPAAHEASSPNGVGAATPDRARDEDGERTDGPASDEHVALKAETKEAPASSDETEIWSEGLFFGGLLSCEKTNASP